MSLPIDWRVFSATPIIPVVKLAKSSSDIRNDLVSCSSRIPNVAGIDFGLLAPAKQQDESEEIMKKESTSKANDDTRDELRPEYHLDYRKSKPNRFAPLMGDTRITVVLEPDVAEVFTSSESVNEALRKSIQAAAKREAG